MERLSSFTETALSVRRSIGLRQRIAPSLVQKQCMDAHESMSFVAPANTRHATRASRGTRQGTTSISAEFAQWLLVVLTGVSASLVVTLLSAAYKLMLEAKLRLFHDVRLRYGLPASWAVHSSTGLCYAFLACACALIFPYARGSGLPQLIAYCNGCKLKDFTSHRTLFAKLIGTSFSLAAGLFVGPEGPIIHMGACVGRQLLLLLYRSASYGPTSLVAAFAHLRNDLDQRDAVAVGAGAGITAAFLAPIAGTIFVVEEASSHFSLALLWRSFTANIAALWATHWCEGLVTSAASLGEASIHYVHRFQIMFDEGPADGCETSDSVTLAVVSLAVICGLVGATFNVLLLNMNSLRRRLTAARRTRMVLDVALISLVTSTLCVLLPETFACEESTVGWLELGQNSTNARWDVNASSSLLRSTCMSVDFEQQVNWTQATTRTCDTTCQESLITGGPVAMLARNSSTCSGSSYSPLGTLLLQSSDETVRALFLRGAPNALPVSALLVGLACWFLLTAITAGMAVPLGLMVPLIIIGGCVGRLFCIWASNLRYFRDRDLPLEPGLFALLGATGVLSGSGQIRLFFTMVMLEVTNQLDLVPYVALTAIVSTFVAKVFTVHGLYHALIEDAALPYVPCERPPDFDIRPLAASLHSTAPASSSSSQHLQPLHSHVSSRRVWVEPADAPLVYVADIMSTTLVTLRLGLTKADVLELTDLDGHHGFPVLSETGRLQGLLTLDELDYFGSDTPIADILDTAPCCVHSHWPVERAHRLFASLGLRHMIVMDREYARPIGIVTRHDLQHAHWRPRQSRFTSTDVDQSRTGSGAFSGACDDHPSGGCGPGGSLMERTSCSCHESRSATSLDPADDTHPALAMQQQQNQGSRLVGFVDAVPDEDEKLAPLMRSRSAYT